MPRDALDCDAGDINLNGAAAVDRVARLKLRGGYDVGPVLGYVTVGVAEVSTSLGSEAGDVFGIGATYRIDGRTTLGAELLQHSFDVISGSGMDADFTTLTVRAALRV